MTLPTSSSSIPNRWESSAGDDSWRMEIEHDRFKIDEPMVVSVWIEGETRKGEPFDALATATPEKAREMAAALILYAGYAEEANRK